MRLKQWFVKFGIQDWWDKKIEELSKGMAQKVQFIVTVLHEPELLIFDEPFSGFDPINANLLKEEILALRDQRLHDHLLDAQHVVRGGDLRPHHADQQVA